MTNISTTNVAGTRQQSGHIPGGADRSGPERRRAERVALRVATTIHVVQQGQEESFEARTVSVNPWGALVVAPRAIAPGKRLGLEQTGNGKRVECTVVRAAREMSEGFHLALEFDAAIPDFWKIDHPPADWRVAGR